MKVALFPYDIESEPLVKYAKQLDEIEVKELVAPIGFGINEMLIEGETGAYTVKHDIEEITSGSVEALMIVESFHIIKFDILKDQIIKAANKGLNIIVARTVEEVEYSIISDICQKRNVQLINKCVGESYASLMNAEELQSIHTPIVAVIGNGERCNKFELQLEIKNRLTESGYRISSVSSRKNTFISEMHPYPCFMDFRMDEKQKILAYNQYIKYIENSEKPDLIIIGVPGGLMPITKRKVGNFGVCAYELFNAISPDFTIMSIYRSEYTEKYFDEINKLLKYRLNTQADCFNMSNVSLDRFSINTVMPLKYLSFDDEEIDVLCRKYNQRLYSRKTYNDMCDFIVDTLVGYDEISII